MKSQEKKNVLDYYFEDISKIETMPNGVAETKLQQLRELNETDPAAIALRNEIIERHLPLVVQVAKKFNKNTVPMSDRIQAGNFGLMRAVETYVPGKNAKFITHAYQWIKALIIVGIRTDEKLIKVPTHVQMALTRINKEMAKKKVITEDTLKDVVEAEGMTLGEFETFSNIFAGSIVPLDSSMGDSDEFKSLQDFIPDPNIDIDRDVDNSRLSEDIKNALEAYLTKEEQEVMVYRYGLMNQTVHTLEEVAALIGKSREHVRQLETSGKDKLRAMASELDDYRE